MTASQTELQGGLARLIMAAGELATKHVYLDPHDANPDSIVRAYCALCLRYGVNCASIDHAHSCAVGQVIACLNELPKLLQAAGFDFSNPSERTSASSSSAPVEQGGAAAEGLACVPQHPAGLRVEYFVESPRNKFNPYMNPCPSAHGRFVCEMERGHSGEIHSSNGVIWFDGQRRLA